MTPLPANLRPTTLEEARDVIEHLLARIVELEERLRQSSQNSSRPPSSDAPAVNRLAKRPPSGRRPVTPIRYSLKSLNDYEARSQ